MGRSRCSTEPKREFAHSLETLTLTLEDVSSIRKVLSCAELDLHCRDRGRFALLDNGKLCFSCQQTKFSLFSRPRTCRLCCRCVCSQCCTKVQLPDKKLSHVPVYALGWSVDPKDPPLHTRNGLSLAGLGPLWAGAAAWVWASLCRDCSQLLDTVVTRSHSSARLLHRA
uniref:Protein spire homolog 2-like n=1 Tax=Petromyzon marinus TaxID=7757 RepID=A0AAJ7XHI6_PETMA|nr:protein spire homolog 2-like [Petromyzon marinus]